MTFAEQLRTGRTRLGLTRDKFAKLLGVSPKTVEAWEYVARTPRQPTREWVLARLANLSARGARASSALGE